MISVNNLACGYNNNKIIENISFEVDKGEILCILGPNGVGKTTLFKTILGFLKILDGDIKLENDNISNWSRKDFAKSIGYVPQVHMPPFPFKVIDVVLMGRTAHLGNFSSPSKKDLEIAEESLASLDISHLGNKLITEISGGERQMVLIARALTQKPSILVLDEPTSNLDFGNQVKVLNHVSKLSKENIGIIMTSHFPDHAFLVSHKVAVLGRNNVFYSGKPEDTVSEEVLKQIYGIDIKIKVLKDELGQDRKICMPVMH